MTTSKHRPLVDALVDRLGERGRTEGVLVAWSGGLDSTVLVDLLRRWARRTQSELAAVHVDHQLRPSSSADASFCTRQARRWGMVLAVARVDIGAGGSTEHLARVQRYAAVWRAARRLGLGVVVTAHHADDGLETALLNFGRGTSSGGLAAGVRSTDSPIASWSDVQLVRPLADVSRQTIGEYGRDRQLRWRQDPTNADTDYRRNQLRHEVMEPLTDKGRLCGPMLDTLHNLADERHALEILARRCLDDARLDKPDLESAALRTAALRQMPGAVIKLALQLTARQMCGRVAFGRAHLIEAAEAIADGRRLELAIRGALVRVGPHFLAIENAHHRGGAALRDRRARPIPVGSATAAGEVPWFGTRVCWEQPTAPAPPEPAPPTEPTAALLGPSVVADGLLISGPPTGATIAARGMDGHKSVRDVLRGAEVPPFLRWRWPCIIRRDQPGRVEWICGLRLARTAHEGPDGAAQNDAPRRALCVRWQTDPSSLLGAVLRRARQHR